MTTLCIAITFYLLQVFYIFIIKNSILVDKIKKKKLNIWYVDKQEQPDITKQQKVYSLLSVYSIEGLF